MIIGSSHKMVSRLQPVAFARRKALTATPPGVTLFPVEPEQQKE